MSFFIWKPEYSVGVMEFDADHKKLTDILSRLYNGVWDEKNSIPRAFGEFSDYILEHFAHEEELMAKLNYPKYGEHKKEHDRCLASVRAYQSRLDRGEKLDPVEVCRFFQNWLEKHTTGMDKKYTSFFNARGIK
jgi:hemerythrin-like metal-binding protein